MEPTLDNTIGAIFLGAVAASILFGFTTLQTLWYYHAHPNDRKIYRCLVGFLWFLDALHLAVCIHAVYSYVISGFGISSITWSVKVQCDINVVVIVIVQCMYASRVWLIRGGYHSFLKYVLIPVVLAGFGIGVTLAYLAFTINTFTELGHIAWAIEAALAITTTIDIIITGSLCYYLNKNKGGTTSLNSTISRIIYYTLSSGLLTSTCSISSMLSFIFMQKTFVFFAFEFILVKVYVNSFIAMLNCRERKALPNEQFINTTSTIPSWRRPDNVDLSDSKSYISSGLSVDLETPGSTDENMGAIQISDRCSQCH